MQRRLGLTVALATSALGLMGCQGERDARLEDSQSAWHEVQRQQGNTYSYAVPTESWTGYATRTALQIQASSAAYRRFESTPLLNDDSYGPIALEWEERGADVGSHPGGAPPVTLDVLYQRCRNEVLARDPGENTITLAFDERNILRTCVYTPRNCADDCSFGVWVAELEMGTKY